jgi:AcrR family transcriptional regulator
MPTSATRVSRRQQRQASRQAILDAAEKRLRDGRFGDLSVDGLMADTGLTRTTFYRHFADMGELVLELLQTVGRELMDISEAWASAGTSEEHGHESLRRIAGFFAREGPLIRSIADAARHDPEIEQVYGAVIARFVELTAQAIVALQADGRAAGADAHETARALTAMNESYLLATFGREPFVTDIDAAVDALWGVWRRAIYTQE